MIQVINFPPANRYLLDGNSTPITVTSDNANSYFRAEIFIDDVLFDEQGWSRKDNITATKDLLYLCNANFRPYFLGSFTSGLFEQTNLKKKVTIALKEINSTTNAVITAVTLPDFYLLYNVKSEVFNDNDKLYLFGLKSQRINMKKDGVIFIPFYANANNENVKVTVYDDLDNILDFKEQNAVTGKKVYQYALNLSEITVVSSILYLRVKISVGTTFIEKIYTVFQQPSYEVKEIVYQNNFGFYIPAYFDGDFEDTSGYKVESYERNDTSTAVYAVKENGSYTINTGGLSIFHKDIVNEVANSIDCYFNNDGKYLRVNSDIKKSTNLKSRLNNYSQDLMFTFTAGLPFLNLNVNGSITGQEAGIITLNTLVYLGTEDNLFYDFRLTFTTSFPIFQLFYQLMFNNSGVWTQPEEFTGLTSPQEYQTVNYENHQVRVFAYYAGNIVYSNILSH